MRMVEGISADEWLAHTHEAERRDDFLVATIWPARHRVIDI